MEYSDGPAETSMIGETPPGRKGARAPRLSEASTVAASEQSYPSTASALTIPEEQMSRTQKKKQEAEGEEAGEGGAGDTRETARTVLFHDS